VGDLERDANSGPGRVRTRIRIDEEIHYWRRSSRTWISVTNGTNKDEILRSLRSLRMTFRLMRDIRAQNCPVVKGDGP